VENLPRAIRSPTIQLLAAKQLIVNRFILAVLELLGKLMGQIPGFPVDLKDTAS
jgi:hypothetical protein